jgi:hypothetical protein
LVSKGQGSKPPLDPARGKSAEKPLESSDGAVCPSCNEVVYAHVVYTNGVGVCNHCKKQFHVRFARGESGMRWWTWILPEVSAAASKPVEKPQLNKPDIIGPSSK